MSIRHVSNSREISKEICLEGMSEPAERSSFGVYFGTTQIYKAPFYLDATKLVNPHIVVLGMSGSGKTYFMKSFIVRSRVYNSRNILLIDWNGEYKDVVVFLDGKTIMADQDSMQVLTSLGVDELMHGIVRIDLSNLKSKEQLEKISKTVLHRVVEAMHRAKMKREADTIIVLDEGWRLLGSAEEVAALFREGRKYGVGFIVATQLVKDINNEALSNTACLVLFRLQNRDDYDILEGAGIIDSSDRSTLSKLDVGSCMIELAERESVGKIRKFLIHRIEGIDIGIYSLVGENMDVQISGRKFIEETEKLTIDAAAKSRIIEFANDNDRNIDLVSLIRLMVELRLQRSEIIQYLRSFHINDLDIIRACERAVGPVVRPV